MVRHSAGRYGMIPSDRIAERQLREEAHRIRSEAVLSDGQRDQPVLEREQLWTGGAVPRPAQKAGPVRIEVVHEVDEVVRHVPATVDVDEVRSMRLAR